MLTFDAMVGNLLKAQPSKSPVVKLLLVLTQSCSGRIRGWRSENEIHERCSGELVHTLCLCTSFPRLRAGRRSTEHPISSRILSSSLEGNSFWMSWSSVLSDFDGQIV